MNVLAFTVTSWVMTSVAACLWLCEWHSSSQNAQKISQIPPLVLCFPLHRSWHWLRSRNFLFVCLFPLVFFLLSSTISSHLLSFCPNGQTNYRVVSRIIPPSVSPGLENPSKGSLSDISDILDIISRILKGQQLGVQQQGNPLVHGVWVESVQQELRWQGTKCRGLHRPAELKMKGLNREVDSQVRDRLFCVSPLPVSPLLPPSAAGERSNSEEDRGCECSEDDDDEGHGVRWIRHRGGGKNMRGLTDTWGLWIHHWHTKSA